MSTQIDNKILFEGAMMEEFQYEEDFVEGGKVSLLLKHSDISKSEYLTFSNLDEMKACALARPYIPLDLWGTLCTMMIETTAFHGAKNTI